MKTTSCLTMTIAVSIVLMAALHASAGESTWSQQRAAPFAAGSESFPEVERLLVPVHSWMGLPGRFGALWVAELWFRNSTDEFVVFGAPHFRLTPHDQPDERMPSLPA
jgi:hypothetical protein